MNKSSFFYILIILLIVLYIFIPRREIPEQSREIVRDSLIRDSIYIVNDSIVEKIKYIEKKYDEKVSTIMSSSDSILLCFFTNYIINYNMTTE